MNGSTAEKPKWFRSAEVSENKMKPGKSNNCKANVVTSANYSDSDSVRDPNYILECNKESTKHSHAYKSRRSSRNCRKINYNVQISSDDDAHARLLSKKKRRFSSHRKNNPSAKEKNNPTQTNNISNKKKLILKDCSAMLISQSIINDENQSSDTNENIKKVNAILQEQSYLPENINRYARTNFETPTSDVSEEENFVLKNKWYRNGVKKLFILNEDTSDENNNLEKNKTEEKTIKCTENPFSKQDKYDSKDQILVHKNSPRKSSKNLKTCLKINNLEQINTEEKTESLTKPKISILHQKYSSDSSDSEIIVLKNELNRKRKKHIRTNKNSLTNKEITYLDQNERIQEETKRNADQIDLNEEIQVHKRTTNRKIHTSALESEKIQQKTDKKKSHNGSIVYNNSTETKISYLNQNSNVNSKKLKDIRPPIIFSSKNISISDSSDDDWFIFKSYSCKNSSNKNSNLQEKSKNNSKHNCDSKNLHNTTESSLVDEDTYENEKCVSESFNKNQLIDKSGNKVVLNGNKLLASEDSDTDIFVLKSPTRNKLQAVFTTVDHIFSSDESNSGDFLKKTAENDILETVQTLNKARGISDQENTSKNNKIKHIAKVCDSSDTKETNFKTFDSLFTANSYKTPESLKNLNKVDLDDLEIFTFRNSKNIINDKCKILTPNLNLKSKNELNNITSPKNCNGSNFDQICKSDDCEVSLVKDKSKNRRKHKNNLPLKSGQIKTTPSIETKNDINQNIDNKIDFKKPTCRNIEQRLETNTENAYRPKILKNANKVIVKRNKNVTNSNFKTSNCTKLHAKQLNKNYKNPANIENKDERNLMSPQQNTKLNQSICCSTPVTNRKRENIFDISPIVDVSKKGEIEIIKESTKIRRSNEK